MNKVINDKMKQLKAEIERLKKEYEQLKDKKYMPMDFEELEELVHCERVKLKDIDTSLITDMKHLFADSDRKDLKGIETWNVSNVRDMSYMFAGTSFDGDLSNWDLKNLVRAEDMFADAECKVKLPFKLIKLAVAEYLGLTEGEIKK